MTNTNSFLLDSVLPKDGKTFHVSLDEHFYFHTNIRETPSPLVSSAPMPSETLKKYQPEDEFIVSVLVTLARDLPSRNTPLVAEKDSQQRMSEKKRPLEMFQGYPHSVRRLASRNQEYMQDGDVESSNTDEESGNIESGASSSEEFLESSELRQQIVRKSSSLSPQTNFLHQLPRRNSRRSDSDGYSSDHGRRKRNLDELVSMPRRRSIKQRKIIHGIPEEEPTCEQQGEEERESQIARLSVEEVSLEDAVFFEEKYSPSKPGRKKLLNGTKRSESPSSSTETKGKRPRWPRFACDKHRREHAKCPDNCPLRPKKLSDSTFC
jgi:hypothetical protein